jgi:type IV secretory pathway VirB10-like protein
MSIHGRDVDPHGSLTGVLRAATAPAHPTELAGEQEAVAAFRVAQSSPRRSLLARILTVKAVIIAAAAVSTGVVVAATGGLPWPHTPTRPPAESPATVDPASVPAPTQPADPPSTSSTHELPGPETPPSTSVPSGPAPKQPHGEENDKPRPGQDEKDNDKDKDRAGSSEDEPTEPSSTTQTPDSSARGAVTAVPPNGAKPPSQGG